MVILWLFIAIVICLLALGYEVIQSLSAARAYVGGEGLWSKAQKEALLDLTRYANSHSETDYQNYLNALRTPLGDKIARLELEKATPDLNIVSTGFIQGRNNPEDVEGMATLFRRFRHTKYMAEAVDIWAEGDALIEQLQHLGDQLHAEVLNKGNATRIAGLTNEIDAVGKQLTPLEDRFSYALGRGARWAAGLLLLVTFAASGLSLAIGVFLTVLMLRHVRETGEKYKRLVETANDAILVIDAETRSILEANARSSALLGMSLTEIVGRDSIQICAEEDTDKFRQILINTSRGLNISSKELCLVRPDGHVVNVEVNTSLTEVEGQKIIQGIFRDITERKRLEEEMLQAKKMEVVGRLAGGIAHDFNNLLMVVLSHASRIIKQPKNVKIRESAETIQIAAEKAASLTKQLLAVGRKQVLVTEVVDLNELIKDVRPLLHAVPKDGVELAFALSTEVLPVRVDPGKIQQVIMNLALNARDAMPERGTLGITTAKQFRGRPSRPYGLLEVTDTGVGMNSATKAHIFEPFFTTKASGKGTGLGLSTVYGIVKQSGGLIEVDSAPGEGTTFSIYFPIVEDPIGKHKPGPAASLVLEGSETVLLAEDQSEIRKVLREYLESQGYNVLEAGNGHEALDVAQHYPSPIDVLVTDVIMPQLRGFNLAAEIHRLDPATRIIRISGYSEEALRESGLLADGTATLVQKPFEPENLVLKIRESLSETQYD